MSRRYRPTWEDQAAAGTAGCLIALAIGAVMVLWRVFRPRPRPYDPASLTNPVDTSAHVSPQSRCITAILIGVWCVVWALSSKDTGSIVLFWGATIFCGGLAVYFGQQALGTGDPSRSRFDAPDTRRAVTYTIYPSPGTPDYVSGAKLMGSLLSTTPTLTFQIVGSPSGTTWQVVDPTGSAPHQPILNHLRSHGEKTTVLIDDAGSQLVQPARFPFYRRMLFFSLANDFAAPIAQLGMLKSYDPLATITNHLRFVRADMDERIIYSLITLVSAPQAKTNAARRIKEGLIRPLTALTQDQQGNEVLLDDRVLAEKLATTLYHAFLVITVESQDRSRLNDLTALASDVSHFDYPGYNALRPFWTSPPFAIVTSADDTTYTPLTQLAAWSVSPDKEWRTALLVLSPGELAALWHYPDETFTAPSIQWAGSTIPEELTKTGQDRIKIGDAVQYGQTVPISLSFAERSTHQYIAGKTRMGKSTLLHTLIHQDIQAGRGVVVIDPHGKLIDDVLARSIPQSRLKDVVLLECGNTEYPIPLNPFRRPGGLSFDSAFNSVYWTLKKIYQSIWVEGRTEMALRNALLALLLDPQATPLDIQRVLTEAPYREYLLTLLGKHEYGSLSAVRYWKRFGSMTPGQQSEIADPILSRTGAFLGRKHLEHMTCHPQALNLPEFIEQHKIVLINLSGEAVRSEVGNLGAIFLSGLFMASEALGYVTGDVPRTSVYVDEVERIVSTPLPDMFAQARKFGLSLTLANQYLDQLDDATLQGILGNVGTKFVFEVGDKDARLLGKYTEPDVTHETLMNLGAFHMAVKTRAGEKTLPALVVRTRAMLEVGDGRATPDDIRRRSRANLGLPNAATVRDFLNQRYVEVKEAEPTKKPPSNGKATSEDGLGDYE